MAITVTQNWDNDGYLNYTGAETLARYNELNELIWNAPWTKFGVFAAFSKEQFKEGYQKLVNAGHIQEGDKVQYLGAGVYGKAGAAEKLNAYYDEINQRIKNECDPQEVYYYEYNNYECCIAWDGDEDAIRKVIDVFGIETAKKVKRLNACKTIESIFDKNRQK